MFVEGSPQRQVYSGDKTKETGCQCLTCASEDKLLYCRPAFMEIKRHSFACLYQSKWATGRLNCIRQYLQIEGLGTEERR